VSEAVQKRIALKDRILEAALEHAAFDGWGEHTFRRAAEDAGVDLATARRLFPQGPAGLLDWLDDWADRRMLAAVAQEDLSRLSVRRRIARLVRARFEALAPYRESVRRAVLARGLPRNLPGGLTALWRACDRIWNAAGFADAEQDGASWYTRRMLLAGVLVATLLYWLEDDSEGARDSWAFLDRRLDDVVRLGQLPNRLSDVFRSVSGLASGRSRSHSSR
jgi:ubiquinone biosynthesis protein COQ9